MKIPTLRKKFRHRKTIDVFVFSLCGHTSYFSLSLSLSLSPHTHCLTFSPSKFSNDNQMNSNGNDEIFVSKNLYIYDIYEAYCEDV